MLSSSFREKFRRYFRYFVISFGAVFLLRLVYSYVVPDIERNASGYVTHQNNNESNLQNSLDNNPRKNYASEKKNAALAGQAPFHAREKYEKIGALQAATREFESDEKKIRSAIVQYKAIIQSEQNTGLSGQRMLRLSVGVDPGKFDALIEDARKIGTLTEVQITKTDKTNEYKNLNAKRISQEKYRSSLIALKTKSGKVTEMIELENKILEIEQEIQNLGVKLGEFDEQNEFCTVRMALIEKRGGASKGFFSELLRKIRIALEWTLQYYLLAVILVLFVSGTLLVILLLAQKLRVVRDVVEYYGGERAGKPAGRRKK